MSKEIR